MEERKNTFSSKQIKCWFAIAILLTVLLNLQFLSQHNHEVETNEAISSDRLTAITSLKGFGTSKYNSSDSRMVTNPSTTNKNIMAREKEESNDQMTLPIDSKFQEYPFCLTWNVNADDWWTQHPKWEMGLENDTHYCFTPMVEKKKKKLFQNIYNNQFKNNCSKVVTQKMFSSGWGADFCHIVDALQYAMDHDRPMQVTDDKPWHFAAKKKGDTPVCPLKSMYCYFLNMTNCPPKNDEAFEGTEESDFFSARHPEPADAITQMIIDYATRPQTWLRKAVYEFSKKKKANLQTPCSVFHVRRGDVVLHGDASRRYYNISEYVDDIKSKSALSNTILLLTDDENAIKEAHTEYPDIHWVHIDRPRFRGNEGGWENQIPSDDPKVEVIVLMSIFQLVQRCQSFVHTRSNLGKYISGIMKRKVPNATVINLDEGKKWSQTHNIAFAQKRKKTKRMKKQNERV